MTAKTIVSSKTIIETMNEMDLITITAAAKMLHTSERGVRRMLSDGRLAGGVKLGKKWLILRSEMQRYVLALTRKARISE